MTKNKTKRRKGAKIEMRVSKEYKNKLKQKALLYNKGNLSKLITVALEDYFQMREDLEIKNP